MKNVHFSRRLFHCRPFQAVGLLLFAAGLASGQNVTSGTSSRPNDIETPRPFDPQTNSTNPSATSSQSQNPFLGSVPLAPNTGGDLPLTLNDAISHALRANLGLLDSSSGVTAARGQRLQALSELLPQLRAEASATFETQNLSAIGAIDLNLPSRVGPYNWSAAQIDFSQKIVDVAALHNLHAREATEHASHQVQLDARNIVVLAAASAYLEVIADASAVRAAEAALESAKSLRKDTEDRTRREVSTDLDRIRATVSERTSSQTLTLVRLRLEKDKLALGRVIGLRVDQKFHLAGDLVYVPSPAPPAEELERNALGSRADLASARFRRTAAEQSMQGRSSERLPSLGVNGYAGGAGTNTGSFYGNYAVTATVQLPLFTGRRIEGEITEARAALQRARNEEADLEERVRFDVRTASLDLEGAEQSVEVASDNRLLAQRGLKEEQDRFDVGLSTLQQVIGARQAAANAENNYIRSVYQDALARLLLIRSTGTAEREVNMYLGLK